MENIGLGDQPLQVKMLIFKVSYLFFLKMCPIFVASVHNFGRSDNNII